MADASPGISGSRLPIRPASPEPHSQGVQCMAFLSFLVLLAIAYMLWRIMDQLPDVVFRLSEIQRDIAEIRRNQQQSQSEGGSGS